ncbi:uncharacterized protein AMSG_11629 [Thecamonas trahens ATCC 50062]|uniref:Metallo-beta-lactamase domain-containing protein n=1 Tax=Thecamonas trahens ATCC 50062 TaxID=461836 RepID=A0A0L0DL00_THETB|nr:hypothetical protein AMSG_11629 [Thecamonas trahens ATCC 50062]KNC52043.1 hypothetical protein AMSG_11629 [Thecamonas trahens ATCC 50062]|eukprot:XP_013762325.1 hypothetical protein AMSG_11629 [Thecamonas trahens ATCC 50062]
MRTIFQETLLGPVDLSSLAIDFPADVPRDAWPDFVKEGRDLGDPRYKEEPLKVSDLIDFKVFNDDFRVELDGVVAIEVNPIAESFRVTEGGSVISEFPLSVQMGSASPAESEKLISTLFVPPEFGVTFVGTSHGFDPAGKTSGFILWMGKRGVIVDPPPYTGDVLMRMGIAPRLIDSIILSHCHADHDAGSFQKILRSSNVRLITTPTILGSFLRKYAAISGFSEEFISNLFRFVPVKIGAPIRVHGGDITFQYSLHTIPCISFQAEYAGKTIAFSGDTCYNPELLAEMEANGTIGASRREQLMNFNFGPTSFCMRPACRRSTHRFHCLRSSTRARGRGCM